MNEQIKTDNADSEDSNANRVVTPLVCSECGIKDGENGAEVVALGEAWNCWGRNCFDFNFRKDAVDTALCNDCEDDQYYCFDCCGALLDHNCVFGAKAFDNNEEFIGYRCPGCGTVEKV